LDGRKPIPLGPLVFNQLFRLNHAKRITGLGPDVNLHTLFTNSQRISSARGWKE
jgi:hypothetical protein